MRMELLGEMARCTIPNRMPVHHGDRHHFHTRVGEKTLIGRMNRLDPEMSFVNRDLRFSSEADHNVARDPVQQAAGKCRGAEPACSDEKEIADGAFRQMRLPIEQDAVEGTGCDRFPFGQDIVQKVCGLDLGRNRAGQVPSRSGDDQVHADTILFGRGRVKRFGHDHHGGGWAEGRIEADVAGSSGDGDAKVRVGVFVPDVIARHCFVEERRPPVLGNRDSQTDRVRRPAKPSKMLVPHEDPASVGANRFIDAIAVEKTMIEDGDDGLLFCHEPIIEINPHRSLALFMTVRRKIARKRVPREAYLVIRARLARLARKAGRVGSFIFASRACRARLACLAHYSCASAADPRLQQKRS